MKTKVLTSVRLQDIHISLNICNLDWETDLSEDVVDDGVVEDAAELAGEAEDGAENARLAARLEAEDRARLTVAAQLLTQQPRQLAATVTETTRQLTDTVI